jgi:hypothetical protein
MLRLRRIGLAMASVLASPSALAQWALDTELALRHDSNLSNARLSADIVSDTLLMVAASASRFVPLEGGAGVLWQGRVAGERHEHTRGLNNVSAGGTVTLRKKWGLGAFAPWGSLSWSSARAAYDSSARNGWLHQLTLAAGRRVHERVDLSASFGYEARTAHAQPERRPGVSGDAFSQRARTLGLDASYAIDSDVVLNLLARIRRGDVLSTTRPNRTILNASSAIAADDAFGPGFIAYRLPGTTYGLGVDLGYTLSNRSQLSAGVQRYLTRTGSGNNYAKTTVALTWTASF